MAPRSRIGCLLCSGLLLSLCLPLMALAVGSGSVPTPAAPRSAEAEYNNGLQAKAANHFPEAAADFRRAVDARPNFPEAWNELGFALRQTDQFSEALKAYEHALRLRPEFPEALEYPGEAYVKMGRLEDARAILETLIESERSVGEIAQVTETSLANVSAHLACLAGCGLVQSEKRGKYVYYHLQERRVRDLIKTAEGILAHVSRQVYECTHNER